MRELIERHIFSTEIKKSRFIAHAAPVETPEGVLRVVDDLKDPAATHNCFAYRIGDVYRFSDDGEPGGTAGRPILAAIEKQGIDKCVVLVIRYFGGIKLGAGGLVRAYGGTAAECLRTAPTRELVALVKLVIKVPFNAIGDIYNLIHQGGATKVHESFETDGVVLALVLEQDGVAGFEAGVIEATRGAGRLVETTRL